MLFANITNDFTEDDDELVYYHDDNLPLILKQLHLTDDGNYDLTTTVNNDNRLRYQYQLSYHNVPIINCYYDINDASYYDELVNTSLPYSAITLMQTQTNYTNDLKPLVYLFKDNSLFI